MTESTSIGIIAINRIHNKIELPKNSTEDSRTLTDDVKLTSSSNVKQTENEYIYGIWTTKMTEHDISTKVENMLEATSIETNAARRIQDQIELCARDSIKNPRLTDD